jgi:hypothetical protein
MLSSGFPISKKAERMMACSSVSKKYVWMNLGVQPAAFWMLPIPQKICPFIVKLAIPPCLVDLVSSLTTIEAMHNPELNFRMFFLKYSLRESGDVYKWWSEAGIFGSKGIDPCTLPLLQHLTPKWTLRWVPRFSAEKPIVLQ